MRRLLIITLFGLTLTTCKDREDDRLPAPGEVELRFRGTFGDAPLLMYERVYPYQEGAQVRFQLFHFYISDVALIREGVGESGPELIEVDLNSFEDIQDEAAAARGIDIKIDEVPAGVYRGIRMGIGVSPDLNRTNPGNYAAGHPLSGNYWSAATGYVFFKIEGNADLNDSGVFSEKLTFHIGLNEFYREKEFIRPIRVEAGVPARLEFTVDARRVLEAAADQFVDFNLVTQDHTNNRDLARFMADNLREAIILK
jgi:hypothetical protein